jgi:hypothetical protein
MVTGMMERMKHDIENFSAPLPEEPVGQGARWETRSRVSEPVAMDRLSTSTLEEVAADGFRLAVAVTGSADAQDMHNPALPEGVTARIKSMKLSGKGTLRGRFDLLMPVESTMKAEQDGEMTITAEGQDPREMSQHVTLNMSITGHAGADPEKPANAETKPEGKPESKPEAKPEPGHNPERK